MLALHCNSIAIFLALLPPQQSRAQYNTMTGLDEHVLATAQKNWQVAETCTSAGTEPTALAAGERTFKLIRAAIVAASSGDDEIEFVDVPSWANSAKFTAIGITNDGTYTVNIRAGTLEVGTAKAITDGTQDSNTVLLGTLAFIIGQQTSTTTDYEMAQSVTVTDGDTGSAWTSSGTVDSDRTCEASIDLEGADFLVIVPTTCSADSKLLVKFF